MPDPIKWEDADGIVWEDAEAVWEDSESAGAGTEDFYNPGLLLGVYHE